MLEALQNKTNTNAFIYTEKGVYRPGETLHISVIGRNKANKNLPIRLKLYNPKKSINDDSNNTP